MYFSKRFEGEKIIRYLILILQILNVYSSANSKFGKLSIGRAAEISEFPFVVGVWDRLSEHVCGGALLSAHHILTAAHCMFYAVLDDNGNVVEEPFEEESLMIIAGSRYGFPVEDGFQIRKVEKYWVHTFFNMVTKEFDAAVVRGKGPFILNQYVSKAPLLKGKKRDHEKRWLQLAKEEKKNICVIMGWGFKNLVCNNITNRIETSSTRTKILQVGKVYPIFTNKCETILCKSSYCWDLISHGLGCTLGSPARPCDSGSPLICEGKVYGIISIGPHDCSVLPTAYIMLFNIHPFLSPYLSPEYKAKMEKSNTPKPKQIRKETNFSSPKLTSGRCLLLVILLLTDKKSII